MTSRNPSQISEHLKFTEKSLSNKAPIIISQHTHTRVARRACSPFADFGAMINVQSVLETRCSFWSQTQNLFKTRSLSCEKLHRILICARGSSIEAAYIKQTGFTRKPAQGSFLARILLEPGRCGLFRNSGKPSNSKQRSMGDFTTLFRLPKMPPLNITHHNETQATRPQMVMFQITKKQHMVFLKAAVPENGCSPVGVLSPKFPKCQPKGGSTF